MKDLHYRIVASSVGYADYVDIAPHSMQGLSDHQMPWKQDAQWFIDHDVAALCGDNTARLYHPAQCQTGLLLKKTALCDHTGCVAGTYTNMITLSAQELQLFYQIAPVSLLAHLTRKESEIIGLLLKGYKRKAILSRCNIAVSTYDFHINNLKQKFDVSSTQELLVAAIRRGICASEPGSS